MRIVTMEDQVKQLRDARVKRHMEQKKNKKFAHLAVLSPPSVVEEDLMEELEK